MLINKRIFLPSLLISLIASATVRANEESELSEENHSSAHVEEFMKTKAEQKAYYDSLLRDLKEGRPLDVASGSCKYISSIFQPPPNMVVNLTFDDGPYTALTPKLLDVLKKYNIKATFFMLGANAQNNLGIVSRAKNEGHLIASHSWNHPNFHTLTEDQQRQQIQRADEVLHSQMSPVKLFRYPYGNSTCSSNAFAKSLGYSGIIGWHVDSCDWAFANNGYVTDAQAKICEVAPVNKANFVGHVISEVNRNRGGIVLMHDVHDRTVASVEEIIVRLKKAGYSFTNLDDGLMTQYYSQ